MILNIFLYCLTLFGVTLSRKYALPVHEQTFTSPAITLHPGQVANTNPTHFILPDFLRGPIAVRYFKAEVVDETNTPVPLSELYIHHWVIYANLGKFNWGPCANFPLTWGIGAEMRGTVYDYPDPYALVFNGNETLNANLHFIRTEDVSDVQLCIECNCNGSTPLSPNGRIQCCPDRSFCWSAMNPTGPTKDYFLKYTVRWTDVDPSLKQLTAYGMDVTSDQQTHDCIVEYMIPQPSVANGQLNVWQNETTVMADIDVIFMQIHQHVGGVRYSVEHFRNGKKIGTPCNIQPVYGNSTGVGNSKGYLVAIPICNFEPAYPLKAGDVLRLTSVYDSRHIPGGHAYHEGVMGLLFFYGERKSATPCEVQLKEACGNPLPADSTKCLDCARAAYGANKLDACVKNTAAWDKGGGQIRFFCLTDNGIKRPYPVGSSFQFDVSP